MNNVVFDRETLQVTGVGRNPLAFEVEINNVDPSSLTKTIQVPVSKDKKDTNGNQIYLLPQADLEITNTVQSQVETPLVTSEDGTANTPIILTVTKRVPVLDDSNNQVTYQPTSMQETTETTDFYGNATTPIMLSVTAEDGTVSEVQKTDIDGNKLYQGLMPFGSLLPVFTTEDVEEQKTDAQGNKLYYQTVSEDVVTHEPQAPLEITQDDERWTHELLKATEDVMQDQLENFGSNMSAFTYDDIVSAKASQIKGLYANALLYEKMDETTFATGATGFKADLGLGVVSLPPGGTIDTQALILPVSASTVKVVTESSQPLTVLIGATEDDMQPLDAKFLDREFATPISTVYVRFTNPTNSRIDLTFFALLF